MTAAAIQPDRMKEPNGQSSRLACSSLSHSDLHCLEAVFHSQDPAPAAMPALQAMPSSGSPAERAAVRQQKSSDCRASAKSLRPLAQGPRS